MKPIPTEAGGVDAYEFYVEVALFFHCDDCGVDHDCPVLDTDDSAPGPPWSTREGERARLLGWYVPPLEEDGSLWPMTFCPTCAEKRNLTVPALPDDSPA